MDFAAYGNTDGNVGAIEHQLYAVPFVNQAIGGADAAALRHNLWNATMDGQYPTLAASAPDGRQSHERMVRHPLCHAPLGTGTLLRCGWRPRLALEDTEYLVYIEKPGPLELSVEKHGYDVLWINPADGASVRKKFSGDHFTPRRPTIRTIGCCTWFAKGPAEHEPIVQIRIARDRAAGNRGQPAEDAVRYRSAGGRYFAIEALALRRQIDARDARHALHDVSLDRRSDGGSPGLPRPGHRARKGTFQPTRCLARLSGADAAPALRHERQRQGVPCHESVSAQPVTPLVLALDTTQEYGSIALVRGAETIGGDGDPRAGRLRARALRASGGDAAANMQSVWRRSTCSRRRPGQDRLPACAWAWPASRDLAEALGKPAAGISNLRAIASFGTAALRAAVLDARRGEVYGAIYNSAGILVQPETVGKFESWLAALPRSGIEILSPDYVAEGVPIVRTPRELAATVARLAPAEAGDPAALDANYVRRSDAELFWKEW